jgi:hypothetical protein
MDMPVVELGVEFPAEMPQLVLGQQRVAQVRPRLRDTGFRVEPFLAAGSNVAASARL